MLQISTNFGTTRQQILLGLFVGFCAMSGGSAVASCGDYLHKRGSEKSSEGPMESHDDNRCENHQHDPLPVVPPPAPERENDELGSPYLSLKTPLGGAGWDPDSGSARCLAGFRSRVDRPPQR